MIMQYYMCVCGDALQELSNGELLGKVPGNYLMEKENQDVSFQYCGEKPRGFPNEAN